MVWKWEDLGLLLEVRKNFKLLESEHVIYHFKALDLEISNIQFVSRNI